MKAITNTLISKANVLREQIAGTTTPFGKEYKLSDLETEETGHSSSVAFKIRPGNDLRMFSGCHLMDVLMVAVGMGASFHISSWEYNEPCIYVRFYELDKEEEGQA